MAIYRVSGQMLQSTLVRDGNNIAFANTASSTATLFVDIANSRVGVNSNVANVALDVVGNIAGGNSQSTRAWGTLRSANAAKSIPILLRIVESTTHQIANNISCPVQSHTCHMYKNACTTTTTLDMA